MAVLREPSSVAALKIADTDNVAIALEDLAAGRRVAVGGAAHELAEPVPRGHKFALRAIVAGAPVVKYGAPIGLAAAPIAAGAHVHSHNLRSALKGPEDYRFSPLAISSEPAADTGAARFAGYRRAGGRVATRNEIWIIATVACVAKVCERIAAAASARHAGRVDGVYAVGHPYGCSQLGDDLTATRALLASLAVHPNAGGVVFMGLGCESNQLEALLAAAPGIDRSRLRAVVSQEVEDEYEAGLAAVDELVALAAEDRREECTAADLVIGVKCGGSDGFSGLTANPLAGRMTDRVVAAGGSALMTEMPEIFGAERLLMARCETREAFDALVRTVNDFKQYFIDHGQKVYENPSPGNIEGGITTLEEKSLGAVQKAGRAPVRDVLAYGGRLRVPGLSLLEGPGNDAVSSTALAAAGATLLLFTTGRGTPLGCPVPTIKIASNSALAARKPGWIDFDAGPILQGQTFEAAADDLFRLILDVAGGRRTRNEENGERAIAIWKRGVTL